MPSLETRQNPLIGPRGIRVWPTDAASPADRELLLKSLPDPSQTDIPPDADLLKSARQRHVLKINGLLDNGDPVVAKLFPLKNPISRLKHKKYARREFGNYQQAQQLGIRTPQCFAFFEKRSAGFVSGSGLLIEFMTGYQDITQAETNDAIPALVSLYNAGTLHADARDENIFVKTGTGGKDHAIIDWQYAKFHAPRAEGLLEQLAAYFIHMAPGDEPLMEDWLERLHKAARHPTELLNFRQDVQRVLHARPSVRQRLNLSLFR